MLVNIACKLCVCGCVLYSKCIKKILISLYVSNSKKFQEISYAKSCVLNMAAVLTSLPKKTGKIYWLNYWVYFLNTGKRFCNSQIIVRCIEMQSNYFVGKYFIPLLHMLQYYVYSQHCQFCNMEDTTVKYLMPCLWSGTFKSLPTKEIHCKAEENG